MLFYFGALDAANNLGSTNDRTKKNTDSKIKEDLFLLEKISQTHIKALNDEKIYRIEQLQEKIKNLEDTVTYSNKLNVYNSLVDNWVRLGGFSGLFGITQDYIDILEMVGIKTIEDLKNHDPEVIYKKLQKLNDIEKPIPTLGMLKHWHRNLIIVLNKNR